MQNKLNGTKTNNSSLLQRIKSLFQGNAVSGPAHTHFHHPSVTIRKSELTLDQQASFDKLFADLFNKVHTIKNQPLSNKPLKN
ncbi:hypothetical protein ACNQGP_07240 [Flavobacterium sp. GT2N3]|uniref:hypothetical protein n=1 Tax=unclassified Flavobacterium TaxID=196869 RepID=UPI003AAA2C32